MIRNSFQTLFKSLQSEPNFEIDSRPFQLSKNVNEIELGGDSFKGSFYSYNIPPTDNDVPLQVKLPSGKIKNLENFLSHQDVYVQSAPYLDLGENNTDEL